MPQETYTNVHLEEITPTPQSEALSGTEAGPFRLNMELGVCRTQAICIITELAWNAAALSTRALYVEAYYRRSVASLDVPEPPSEFSTIWTTIQCSVRTSISNVIKIHSPVLNFLC
jgi:hypothetical protein